MTEASRIEVLRIGAPGEMPAKLTARRPAWVKSGAIAVALLGTAAGIAAFGYDYWTTGRYLVSTDDAYVQADSTTVAPKVSGYIAEVDVGDNQPVKVGQILARIDDRDFRSARDRAQADVAAAEAAIRNIDAQTVLQSSVIAQARAAIVAGEAKLRFANQESDRYHELVRSGDATVQHTQQVDELRSQDLAELDRDHAGLAAAQQQLVVLATERDRDIAALGHARAVLEQAELNLSYTQITAPVDGTVGARSLRVGQYVTSGTQLMQVVPLNAVYVVANFKETQLANVRAGQPVEISVDGLPGRRIEGRVDSLSPASGLEFSLLPPDNATGNFTKIVQRIPVKIALGDSALLGRLRPGMSVEPTVNTKPSASSHAG